MFSSELAWVVRVPIPYGNCGKENPEIVAKFVDREEIACPSCGVLLDLNTREWIAFRQAIKNVHVGKKAPLAPVKKPA